jgi:hypothetical protein
MSKNCDLLTLRIAYRYRRRMGTAQGQGGFLSECRRDGNEARPPERRDQATSAGPVATGHHRGEIGALCRRQSERRLLRRRQRGGVRLRGLRLVRPGELVRRQAPGAEAA